MIDTIVNAINMLHNNYILMIGLGVFLVTYILKNIEKVDNRFLPLIACGVGVAIGVFATWATDQSIALGIYDGVIAGLIAAGGKDLLTLVVALFTGKIEDWNSVGDILDDGKLNGSNKDK